MLHGLPVHIVQRGNNREPCFFDDEDCLMTNHVHLLATAQEETGCAFLMKHMGQLHTQYVNRRYGRSGTLWEGRFRSCIVQTEEYLLSCYRYIELNPVRAKMCAHPSDDPWSSYRANAQGVIDARITPHEEFLRLGITQEDRTRSYAGLFGSDPDPKRLEEIRAATNGNVALGDEAFKKRLSSYLGRRAYRGRPGRPGAPKPDGPALI